MRVRETLGRTVELPPLEKAKATNMGESVCSSSYKRTYHLKAVGPFSDRTGSQILSQNPERRGFGSDVSLSMPLLSDHLSQTRSPCHISPWHWCWRHFLSCWVFWSHPLEFLLSLLGSSSDSWLSAKGKWITEAQGPHCPEKFLPLSWLTWNGTVETGLG